MLAAPALTLATDRYVASAGSGSAPCTSAANPCMLIADAISVPSVPGDVIHVGGGGYGPVTLPNGVSLIRDSFASSVDTSGIATIGAIGITIPAVTVAAGTSPRVISGFRMRGGNNGPGSAAVYGNTGIDNLTVSDNTFDDASTNVPSQLIINSGSPRITGNTFIGTNDGQPRKAIVYDPPVSPASPEIDSNTITGFLIGIQVEGLPADFTTADIHDNEISGIYYNAVDTPVGMFMANVNGTVTANRMQPAPGQLSGIGLNVSNLGAASGTLKLSRNEIYDFLGVNTITGATPVELDGDVFGNNGAALSFFGVTGGVTATGITASGSTGGLFYEIRLNGTALTLNSSIVGDQGIANFANSSTCAITFSRGPITGPPGSATDCLNDFQTSADPVFANPAANDFHLLDGSPMIDAGDPMAPAMGASDIDGDPRGLSGVPACAPSAGIRDIGADEFVPAIPASCTPPPPPFTGTPPPASTATTGAKKRCKKRKKRKPRSAAAAKKKSCKKKRKR